MTVPRSDTRDQKDGADRYEQEAVDERNLEGHNRSPARSCKVSTGLVGGVCMATRRQKSQDVVRAHHLLSTIPSRRYKVEGYATLIRFPKSLCCDRQKSLQCQVLPQGSEEFQTKIKKQCLQNLPHCRRECRNIIEDDLGSDAACFTAHFSL